MTFMGLPDDASPRLKAVQIAQISIILLTIVTTLLTAVIPLKHKAFTFGLLYSLILTSITTGFFVRKEQLNATHNALTKSKYVKYQVLKMVSAVGLSIVGFIAFLMSAPAEKDIQAPNEQGFWLLGVKINGFQSWILWIHFFNWLFLWAGLFYSCCMSGNKQYDIVLASEDEDSYVEGTVDDEETARH